MSPNPQFYPKKSCIFIGKYAPMRHKSGMCLISVGRDSKLGKKKRKEINRDEVLLPQHFFKHSLMHRC